MFTTATKIHGLAILFVIALSGCYQKPIGEESGGDQPKVISKTQLTDLQRKQREIGLESKDQLITGLLSELSQSLSKVGAADSIQVCKEIAPKIAKKVSEAAGVRIGRTSFKLRNPENKAPKWATQAVREKTETEQMVSLPDDKLGLLLPIRLKDKCILCHGTKEQVSAGVQAALIRNYPKDEATGFKIGDVRGYFWVEVPKSAVKD